MSWLVDYFKATAEAGKHGLRIALGEGAVPLAAPGLPARAKIKHYLNPAMA